MATADRPIIGKWYQEPESGEAFEVLAVNEEQGVVDVRYLERGRRRLELDNWQTLHPVRVAGPGRGPTDTAGSPSAPPPATP